MKRYNNKPKRHKKPYRKQPVQKTDEFIRLNKFIANSGVCSRRQADELITSGQIKVNGEVVRELGIKIKRNDKVEYKGKILKGEKNVYIVMNKPKDFITTIKDPKGRKTVMDLFGDAVKERIYPVGRLDRNTTGVLLFTNDGDLTKKLTHPEKKIPKVYLVTLNKQISKNDILKIAEGIELDDGFISADAIYYFSQQRKDKVVVEIHSGRNRIVRRIFEYLDYEVKNLDRIEFAGITKKDLKRGQWRYLAEKEVGFLKMIVGNR
jgi:23S rRNA pseudouridine2605 synthase